MNISEHRPSHADFCVTRRQFLNRFGMGFGALSLAALLGPGFGGASAQAAADLSPLAPRAPHFPGTAKRVIHIFTQGGPSHIDTWDPKPGMANYAGQDVPLIGGLPLPPVFIISVANSCAGTSVVIERMTAMSSMHSPIFGKISLTSTPLWPDLRKLNTGGSGRPPMSGTSWPA